MKKLSQTFRWTARVIGILLIMFCLFFFIGSRVDSQNPLEAYNVLTFAVLGIGLIGLFLAWWKEVQGGILSLLGFVVFNLLAVFSPVEGSSYGFFLLFPLIPSALHLLAWWLERNHTKNLDGFLS